MRIVTCGLIDVAFKLVGGGCFGCYAVFSYCIVYTYLTLFDVVVLCCYLFCAYRLMCVDHWLSCCTYACISVCVYLFVLHTCVHLCMNLIVFVYMVVFIDVFTRFEDMPSFMCVFDCFCIQMYMYARM